jgi:hypothetical protein
MKREHAPIRGGWQNAAGRVWYWTAIAVITCSAATAAITAAAEAQPAAVPWTGSQTLTPDDLVQWLRDPISRPVVVYVGPRSLFRAGHIPGAVRPGTASEPDGLAALRRWARTQSASAPIVIYCGCCPFDVCPNVKPAFETLRDVGLSDVRVLVLPTGFSADWVEKGFPVEKQSGRAA